MGAGLLIAVLGAAFFWISSLRKANTALRASREDSVKLMNEAIEAHKQTKGAMEELRQSRLDLDRAQRVGQIGSWRLDVQQNVLTWSDENHRIFGVPEGTPLTYEMFLGIVHPEDRQSVDTHWKAGMAGAPYDMEHRILVGETVRWVREKAYLEFDDAGKLLGGFGITQDISERKKGEEALRASERRWAVTLSSIGDAVMATDTKGQITFLNKIAEELTGWSMAEAAGKPVKEVFRIVNEHTRAVVEDPVSKVIQTGMIVGLANHTMLLRRDNSELPIDDSGAPIRDDAGHLLGVVLVFRDVSERRRAEEALLESEQRVRRKLESVLSPEGDLGELELADLIDTATFQNQMENFYALTRIPMSIIDLKGKVLVGAGWQDICTKFHRTHPVTLQNCLDSDINLSSGLSQGEKRLYKCQNGMWDMATPISVDRRHVGNIFTGQFFFDDETIDYEFFRAQARKYGFDETQYLAALDRVPRLSRAAVERGMSFFIQLADTLSRIGFSNVKLARLLAERDRLTDSLRESQLDLERTEQEPGRSRQGANSRPAFCEPGLEGACGATPFVGWRIDDCRAARAQESIQDSSRWLAAVSGSCKNAYGMPCWGDH